jgi:hypothetical protein
MIFRRTANWAAFWRYLLLFGLFFGAFVGLRFVTMVSTGRAEISEMDLAGAAAFALFFARLVGRSESARGRRIIAGAVLLGPPLVVLAALAGSAVWEAWLRLIRG